MTSILDGLRADVTAALDGTLRDGAIWRATVEDDGFGNPVSGPHVQVGTFEGIRGSFDSVLASVAGIPRTDAKIEILASSATVEPLRTDKLNIESAWWYIEDIEIDPAGAWFTCQCSAASAP